MTDFAIRTQNLRKTYAGNKKMPPKEALKGVTLDIPRGSIFGLLGPNGAGKSTFINILAGLVTKTDGSAEIWGHDIVKSPRSAKACLGVVPQEISADVFFTPLEALEIQAGLYGVPKSERRSMEILDSLGLADKADAYVRQLSGGMKRRLLVAKAMVHNPPVLILDEPTAGVDIELRKQMWDQVRELHARGVTIILTTHYLEEAQELCDTIGIIHNGELITCQPKNDLLASLDNKSLLITPEEMGALPSIDGCDVVQKDGNILVNYKPSQTKIADILGAIQQANIHVKDLSTMEADLEDVFMQLTYGRDA